LTIADDDPFDPLLTLDADDIVISQKLIFDADRAAASPSSRARNRFERWISVTCGQTRERIRQFYDRRVFRRQ
jgi:hypothetical protein